MTELIVNDGPDDHCYGCGHQNPAGLRLRFAVDDAKQVEAEFTAPEHLRGAPGVIHGGIQATLLDEVLGMAIHAGGGDEGLHVVTVDFQLAYRRPVHCETPIRIRGRFLRAEGRDYYAEGEIVDAQGEALTTATARWRSIRPLA